MGTVSKLASGTYIAAEGNYEHGRAGQKICKFTPHHMAGVLTAKQCAVNIFQKPGRQASANYCIGNDGDIVCNVYEDDRAYTSSSRSNDRQAITVEVSNCEVGGQWKISDAAWNSLINLAEDVCRRYGFRLAYDGTSGGSLTTHDMFSNTNCPGPYLKGKLNELASIVNSRLDGNASNNNSSSNKKSNEEIANEVIAGKWGNGDARRTALQNAGYDYSTIQSIVNQKLTGKSSNSITSNKKSIDTIVEEVIAGKWGNGDARRTALQNAGYDYSTIQSIVNQKLTGKSSNSITSNKKSIDTIVEEVIAGKWGNGEDRKTRLQNAGYNYNEVQAAVNNKLSGKSTSSNKKSNETIANEVIKGLWGNGTDRKNRLTAAGYDYNAIQKIVNQKLK